MLLSIFCQIELEVGVSEIDLKMVKTRIIIIASQLRVSILNLKKKAN